MRKLELDEAKEIMKGNDGNLDLFNTDIDELPDNLTVDGFLNLSYTNIIDLPNNL